MSVILIVESNPPEFLSQGFVASTGFVNSLLGVTRELQLRVVSPYSSTVTPQLFTDIDGVIFTGSWSPYATDAPEVAPLRQAMQVAFDAGKPIWGSCNGMQLAAVVLGGAIAESPAGHEIGLARDIKLTEEGRKHPMMSGRADGFAVPCIHRDQVSRVPSGATVLAGNGHSAVQAMVVDKDGIDFWGTQYHPELTSRDIAQAVRGDGMFSGQPQHAEDLELAEVDESAAQRLGTTTVDQQLQTRARELFNWVTYVDQLADSACQVDKKIAARYA